MKKLTAIVLSLVLVLCGLNVAVASAYEESLTFEADIKGSFIVDVTGSGKVSSNTPKYFYPNGAGEYSTGYSCYDYLDDAQKYVYDAIASNVGKLSFTIQLPNNLFAYSDFSGEYFDTIMNAFCTDRPDIFYYAGYGISGGTLYSGNKYLKTLEYSVGVYDSSYYKESNLPSYYNALMKKIPEIPVDLSNRYTFIKSVHDYLADTVYYPDLNSSDYKMSAHDAYGALVEGRAVCQGYSDAIKILCDYYNIPCVCISGTANGGGHMWNAVQMDDGKWYFIDCTWDDQGSYGTYYDFFLVGSQSTNTYFGGAQFGKEHVNDSDILLPLTLLNYSAASYNRAQNHNTLFGATLNAYADFSENNLYLSVFDAGKSNVYYNGIYVPVDSFSNSERFTVSSGSNSSDEEWNMVILADLNSDGKCDANDYSSAVNLIFASDNVLNTPEELSCDVNVDGVIDVLDASVIARASSGLNTSIVLE